MNDITKRKINMAKMRVIEKKPEILLCSGIGCIVGGFVWGCVSSSKLEKSLSKYKDVIDEAKENILALESIEEPSEDAKSSLSVEKKAVTQCYGKIALEMVKLYGPPIALTCSGIGCIVGSHSEMKSRNIGLSAALLSATTAFDEYKKRVIDRVGEEEEEEIRLGLKRSTVTEEIIDGTTGKKKKVKKEILTGDKQTMLDAEVSWVFFDEVSPNWKEVPNYNYSFLRMAQNMLNDKLRYKGLLFENDVRDELGLPRTKEGAVLGWVIDETDPDKTYIDFGCWDMDDSASRRFMEGVEPVVLLKLNTQGNVWSLMKNAKEIQKENGGHVYE